MVIPFQINVYTKTQKIPKAFTNYMTEKSFNQSRSYGLRKLRFTILKILLESFLTIAILYIGVFPKIWHLSEMLCFKYIPSEQQEDLRFMEISINLLFILLINTCFWLKSIPIKYYQQNYIQVKFGIKRPTTFLAFVGQTIKTFLMGQVITLSSLIIFSSVSMYLVHNISIAILLPISLSIVKIFSYLSVHLSYKKEPLTNVELRTRIEELAKTVDFPLKEIYVVNSSPKYNHCRIHYCIRNIYIFKNLMVNKGKENEKYDNEEIAALVAHELGTWKYKNEFYKLIFSHVQYFIAGLILKYFSEKDELYTAIGFNKEESHPLVVGGFVITQFVLLPITSFLVLFMNIYSQYCVYKADAFVKEMGLQNKLSSALMKLSVDNLMFPKYDYMYMKWYKPQPTVIRRLRELKDKIKTIKAA